MAQRPYIPKTTASVPPDVASEFKKARAPQAASEATGAGYTKTKPMFGAKTSQFGLPKSAVSKMKGKGNAV